MKYSRLTATFLAITWMLPAVSAASSPRGRDAASDTVTESADIDVHARNIRGYTALHNCLTAERCKLLIKKGADIHATTPQGDTPLHTCHNAEICKVLLAAGADPNAKAADKSTPLHSCSEPEMAKLLIKAGADVNARDEYGHTPLHLADEPGVVKHLIEAGADINARNSDGADALYLYCVRGSAAAAQILLESGVNATDATKTECLKEACHMGHPDIVKLLLDNGAPASYADEQKNNLLHYAANRMIEDQREKRAGIVRLLVKAGVSPHDRNTLGLTPLHKACMVNECGCVEALLECGAEVNALCNLLMQGDDILADAGAPVKEAEQATPLHVAAAHSAHECIPLLLASGADAQAKDSKGRTALKLHERYETEYTKEKNDARRLLRVPTDAALLLYGVKNNDYAIIARLKSRGIDFNLPLDEMGQTALHLAEEKEMVNMLLACGANVNVTSKRGNTPLHSTQDTEIAQILLMAGANPNARNNIHETALHFGILAKNMGMIKILAEITELNPVDSIPPLHYACMVGNAPAVSLLLEKGANPHLHSKSGKTALQYAEKKGNKAIIRMLKEHSGS